MCGAHRPRFSTSAWSSSRARHDGTFAPGQDRAAEDFIADVEAALRGEAPTASVGGVTGLSFVGFDVETANSDVGSICQIGVVRFIDGVEVAAESWLCAPPSELAGFEDGNVAIHGITPEMVADQPGFAGGCPVWWSSSGICPWWRTTRSST